MQTRRIARVSVIAGLLLGCDSEPRGERSKTEPSSQPVPPPSEPSLSPSAPPASVDPPAPAEAAPPVAFDPTTVTEAKVRILTLHHDRGWSVCGIMHSTGAIEVEVLDVGEPAPKLILIVSCPVDYGELLEVGTVISVKLHARRQSWPTPPALRELPAELPRRYVARMKRVEASPG